MQEKISKIVKSRGKWKDKAKRRGAQVRRFRKSTKAQKLRRAEDEKEISRLNEEVTELRRSLPKPQLLPTNNGSEIQHRTLCVLIVVCGIVSFRSVPRILQLFNPFLFSQS